MARLTAEERKKMKPGEFAGPHRSFPVNDRNHAANAKARATQAVKSGRMSKSEESRIDQKANRVLERGHGRESHERPEHSAKARHGTEKTMPLHPKIKSAAERRREGDEMNSLPKPRSARMHMGSKGYDEKAKGGERVKSTAAEHRREEKPRREHEPKKEARAHERAGEKRHMEHKKAVERKDHKREEHREHEKRAEKGHSGEHKHVHVHHHVHHE